MINHRREIRHGPTQHSRSRARACTHTHKLGWKWVAARARQTCKQWQLTISWCIPPWVPDRMPRTGIWRHVSQHAAVSSTPKPCLFLYWEADGLRKIPSRFDAASWQIVSLEKFSKVSVQVWLMCVHWCFTGVKIGYGNGKRVDPLSKH